MKKSSKIITICTLLAATLAPTLAAAHDVWECGGRQNLRFGSQYGDSNTPHKWWTTRIQGTNQASNTWEDWIWRGKWEGHVQYCGTSAGIKNCTFNWGGSKTQGYSNSTGNSVGFDLAYGGVEAGKRWLSTVTTSKSTTYSWAAGAIFDRGMWAEPYIGVARRWKQGYFAGFFEPQQQVSWDQCNNNLAWAYNWNGERRDGHWVKNEAQYTFKGFLITPDRNKL